MSEVKGISTITNRAGTGAVNFTNGVNISGSDSGLAAFKHTEGSTEPTSPANGDTWWDTTNEVYKVYVNDEWTEVTINVALSAWYGARGLYAGGTSSTSNQIEYISIDISSNASDFGDLTVSRGQLGGASNGTRAVWAGGYEYGNSARSNVMDYVTVATTANAQDFGDLTQSGSALFHSIVGDGTYGFRCGGFVGSSQVNNIDRWTQDTTGNASDHGDLTVSRSYVGAACDGTYGVVAGGSIPNPYYSNVIDTFTTETASNATDFGDLNNAKYSMGVGYDTTRAVFAAGWSGSGALNVIDYVTMATASNATDFGDLTAGEYPAGTSDGTLVCFATGTGLGANIHKITIQTLGNAVDTGYDLVTSYSNGAGGVSGNAS